MSQWRTGNFGSGFNGGAQHTAFFDARVVVPTGQRSNYNPTTQQPMGEPWNWEVSDIWQDRGGLRTDAVTVFQQIVTVAVAAITLAGQAITVNAKTSVTVVASTITLAGQAIPINARKLVAITATAITLTGQTIATNARTTIAAGQATIIMLGRAISIINDASGFRQLWNKIRISF